MKKYSFFVGIDVSKDKLDITLLSGSSELKAQHFIVNNNDKGFGQIVQTILKRKAAMEDTLFCFENTGIYSVPLSIYLSKKALNTRGKNDKTDSKDIAFYASTHLHKLKLSVIAEADLMELKMLFAEREKVVKALSLMKSTNEGKGFLPKEIMRSVLKINLGNIRQLQKSLKQLDEK